MEILTISLATYATVVAMVLFASWSSQQKSVPHGHENKLHET